MLSGKDRNRPGLDELLRFARSGDVVITESISRISRSTRDFLNIMDELTSKGVAFVSKKEAIDTTTPQGKFMLTVFAALSELERSQILQRQAEGIAIAKQKGVYKGRIPKKIDMYLFERLYKEWKEGKIKQRYIMEKLNISRSKLYELIRSYEANSNDE
jgi:DNA invertase Pin-like site-specific DNA recombinase